jgi:hypothetical protein
MKGTKYTKYFVWFVYFVVEKQNCKPASGGGRF